MDVSFYLFGGLTILAVCAFMWPRSKPEPHGFGDREFNRAVQQGQLDKVNSHRREIARQRRRAKL